MKYDIIGFDYDVIYVLLRCFLLMHEFRDLKINNSINGDFWVLDVIIEALVLLKILKVLYLFT